MVLNIDYCCENNNLIWNMNKTREVIVDFKRNSHNLNIINLVEEVQLIEECKYLGVSQNN